jgi:Homeodomain-like domain
MLFWVLLSRWWANWQRSLIIVQPAAVLRWRRRGFWAIWVSGSCGRWRGGRPKISSEVRALIVQMSQENFLWGAPRIHGELLKLGFDVSQATVSRYMPRRGYPPTQTWGTFLRNQAIGIGPIVLAKQVGYQTSFLSSSKHGSSEPSAASPRCGMASLLGLWRHRRPCTDCGHIAFPIVLIGVSFMVVACRSVFGPPL